MHFLSAINDIISHSLVWVEIVVEKTTKIIEASFSFIYEESNLILEKKFFRTLIV